MATIAQDPAPGFAAASPTRHRRWPALRPREGDHRSPGAPLRVVVADAAVIIREGLARLLTEVSFEVVGLAGDPDELFGLAERLHPDVVIVDVRMPPTYTDEGLRAALAIRARWPDTGVLVLSQHLRANHAQELLLAGSDGVGYLLKERVADLAELASSVERIARGGSVLHPAVVERLIARPKRTDDALEHLTDREREVLALMAEGRSNKAIARRLFVTEHTIEKHIKSILGTLRLRQSPDDHRRVLAVLTYVNAG